MRRAFVTAILALALPAAAQAKLLEPPATDLGHVATCLRATGVPGELLTTGTWGAHGGARLYHATPSGAVAGVRIPVAFQATCAEVASDPAGGTAVAVVSADRLGGHAERRILVALRSPGAPFRAPFVVGRTTAEVSPPSVAIDARGDAIVAWIEHRYGSVGFAATTRVVRIPAGRGPARPQTLQDSEGVYIGFGSGVSVALDGAGEATVAWVKQAGRVSSRVLIAHAPVSRRLGTPQRLSPRVDEASPQLAAAPGGRTLVAVAGRDGVAIAERAPGARTFTRVGELADNDLAATGPIAVTDGGAAVVTLRSCCGASAPVLASARAAAGGAFGFPRRLGGRVTDGGDITHHQTDRGVFDDSLAPHLLLRGDGRAAVAFVAAGPDGPPAARLATGSAVTRLHRASAFGGPILGAEGAVPFATDSGGIGLAWTEDFAQGADDDLPAGPGRLRVALPAATPAPPRPAPAVALRVAPRLSLRRGERLPVAVRCATSCDLRVTALGRVVSRSLPGSRWTTVGLPATALGFGTPAGRQIDVTARAAAPGGASASDAGATTVVVRHAPRPLPTIADLRARRRGDRVIVTWRTAAPAPHVRFFLLASRTRRTSTAVAGRSIPAGSRTRHRAVLGPDDRFPFGSGSGPAHWVTLSVEADDRIGEHGATVARIR